MKELIDEKNLPQSRKEEEDQIRDYIAENTDLDQEEAEDLIKNLDLKTIAAFEEALDKVAQDYERERSKAEILYNFIRQENLKEKLGKKSQLIARPPDELTEEVVVELLTNIDNYEDLDNIDLIETDKDTYYYDIYLWTRQYADTAVILEEKDMKKAIATRTRKDCKIYPRPLQVSALFQPPYSYSLEEIQRTLRAMEEDQDYRDIKTVQASNGGTCIYSTDEMSEKYARSLCEYLEVELEENQ